MFVIFTPFSYLFLTVYSLVLIFMFTLSNFYLFWVYIEIAILLFIGLSYTIFLHRYTQLMLYFLIQTLASFGILVFYTLDYRYLLYFSLFLKLGMFPFMSWYLNVLYRFPSFILLIRRTLHKLPPLFLFYLFYSSRFRRFVLVSALFSLIVGGFYMLSILDLRYLIVVSSMANNSFLLLGIISGKFIRFFFFFVLYFFNMLFLLLTFQRVFKPLVYSSRRKASLVLLRLVLLLNIAALPPIPMFIAKFIVIYDYLLVNPLSLSFLVLLVLCNVAIMARYCQIFMKFVTQLYTNVSSYLLY